MKWLSTPGHSASRSVLKGLVVLNGATSETLTCGGLSAHGDSTDHTIHQLVTK
uniref:Uncharacterized protein n=1 Tax=Anguilla anguilla TaxID=7936 RepID=A0A0E9U4S3_ANGAN